MYVVRRREREREGRSLGCSLYVLVCVRLLDRLQADEIEQTVPTIGFNMETLQYKNIKFQVWDLGGQTSIRPYWRCYYPNTDAIIYVVDSADIDRLDIAKQELHAMLEVDTCTPCGLT